MPMITTGCPECGRYISVLVDGTLRHHVDKRKSKNGTPWHPRCTGAGAQVMSRDEVADRRG